MVGPRTPMEAAAHSVVSSLGFQDEGLSGRIAEEVCTLLHEVDPNRGGSIETFASLVKTRFGDLLPTFPKDRLSAAIRKGLWYHNAPATAEQLVEQFA